MHKNYGTIINYNVTFDILSADAKKKVRSSMNQQAGDFPYEIVQEENDLNGNDLNNRMRKVEDELKSISILLRKIVEK